MRIQQLGHAVVKVRNREMAEEFYGGLLGMPIVARRDDPPLTFFSFGNHHDFAILAVGDDAPAPAANATGLFHLAFRIGDCTDELREAKIFLEGQGVTMAMIADHSVTQSLYFHDPDGNMVELYVDTSDVWHQDPQRVADLEPLAL